MALSQHENLDQVRKMLVTQPRRVVAGLTAAERHAKHGNVARVYLSDAILLDYALRDRINKLDDRVATTMIQSGSDAGTFLQQYTGCIAILRTAEESDDESDDDNDDDRRVCSSLVQKGQVEAIARRDVLPAHSKWERRPRAQGHKTGECDSDDEYVTSTLRTEWL